MKQRRFLILPKIAVVWLLACSLAFNACASSPKTASGPAGEIRPDHSDSSSAALRYREALKAKVAELGADPTKLFVFVGKSLSYEGYPGALRGSRGALLAGGGNAADKTLLLYDFLRVANPKAELRFAFCTLSDEQASQLSSKALAAVPSPPTPAPQAAGQVPPGDIDPAAQKQAEQLVSAWSSLAESVKTEAASLAALASQGGASSPSPFVTPAQLAKWSQQHVWLQRLENARWIDYDATLDAAGSARCSAERTATELPEQMYHHVSVRVRAEQREQGHVASQVLLSGSWRTASLVGSSVTMLFAEPFNLEAWVKDASSSPPAGSKRYTPILIVDDNFIKGSPLTLPAPPQPASSGGNAGALDLFGNKLQGNATPGPSAAATTATTTTGAEITGVWLDIDVAAPKGATRTIERPVFDRVGFAARLHGKAQDAALTALEAKNGEYASLDKAWNIALWVGEAPDAPDAAPSLDRADPLQALSLVGTYHHSYYGLRQALLAREFGPQGPRIAVTGPSVSLLMEQFGAADDGSDIVSTIDRLDEQVGALPGKQAPTADTPVGALWGAAALEAERFLFIAPQIALGSADSTTAASAMVDVKSVFDVAQIGNVHITKLDPASAHPADALQASDEAKARIASSLQDGNAVIAPERSVRVGNADVLGWWNVNPQNGFFTDEFETGGHDAAETTIQTGQAVQQVSTIRRYAMALYRAYCYTYKWLTAITFLIAMAYRWDWVSKKWIGEPAIFLAGALTLSTRVIKCPNGAWEPPALPPPPPPIPPPFPLPVI
ncbi:MAG TPA: hypothetical protein VN934_10385 [Candidatus Tumulicola sp.]|nr:hypothetical protein [Candidatus Tumulicola sp.]